MIGGGDHDGGASASLSSSAPEVTVRVAVRAPERGGADVSELVLRVLALLKAMGGFTVVAVDARQPGGGGGNGVAQASLTLRATVRMLTLLKRMFRAKNHSSSDPNYKIIRHI